MAGLQATASGRAEEQSALVAILDGIIERMLRSPLMKRAPAQCSAEEQVEQAALLGDLVQLRTLRQQLEGIHGPRNEQVAAYWPELAALLAPARRPTSGKSRPPAAPAVPTLGGLYDSAPHEPDVAETTVPGSEPGAVKLVESVEESRATNGPDLAHLLLEALTIQGRALNTTQMLAWLRERGTGVSREDVMNTLFGHEELFKRRGAGHWVVAGRES